MKKLSPAAHSLWAKKSKDGRLLWLPLVIHMSDSASVAKKLWNRWLPHGVKQVLASGGDEDLAAKLFIFLAAVHDLGKATPVFQSKQSYPPCRDLDERILEKLAASGLPMRSHREFKQATETPHALASQILLEQAGCARNIAVIPGAHHGKPPSYDMLINHGIGVYGFNYHLEYEGKEAWTAVTQELIGFALNMAGFSSIEDLPIPNMEAQVLLSGLLVMTDWIASNERYFPYIRLEDKLQHHSTHTRIQFAWEQLALPYPWDAGNVWMSLDLYRERFAFVPNELQSAAVQTAAGIHSSGIIVLEAPMGAGKTEAALACAEILAAKTKRSGVFFALPTQATSDGIFPRLLDWIRNLDSDSAHAIELAHGKAQFNEEYQTLKLFGGSANVGEDEDDEVIVHQWFGGTKKTLLADFVAGTIDQLLLAALKQKHVMLRHLGLAGKVVIIDECHAYDAYMGQYLYRALNWLGAYQVPVIVLSATLPASKRQAVVNAYLNSKSNPNCQNSQSDPLGRSTFRPVQPLEWTVSRNYPLITYTDGGLVRQKVVSTNGVSMEVLLDYIGEDELVDRLDALLSDGGCAGVMVNTVKRAQHLTRKLRDRFGEETVRLLHSRFLAPDRAQKELELIRELGKPGEDRKRPEKRIIVGTQVLEQSLDIDFDILFTDICPMDLLLQRIGRLHRHQRTRPEKLKVALCLIMGVDGEAFEAGTATVYDDYLLLRTKALLPHRLILPEDIPQLVQDTYDDERHLFSEPSGYQEAKRKRDKVIADKKESAGKFQIDPPWPEPWQNLASWLDTDVSDRRGEAAVRDTDESLEVLLVQEKDGGRLYLLPWVEDGREIPRNEMPDANCAQAIARQSVRLPPELCKPWMIDKTIEELERLNIERLPEWQKSHWLKGGLALILDEKYSARLCGYRLTYDQEYGLIYEKEVGADD